MSCSLDLHAVVPFSPDDGLNSMAVDCSTMKSNSVGEEGYGPNIATAATSFYLTAFDAEKLDVIVGDTGSIPGHKSGDLLPILQVTAFDHFNQGPALTKPTTLMNSSLEDFPLLDYDAFAKATADSEDCELSDCLVPNPLITDVSSGAGNITVGAPLQKPGNYSLLLWVGDDKSANIKINVILRNCTVNEASVQDGMLCEECNANRYNFEPENGNCEPCPDDCACSGWGVAPTEHHWISSPCSTDVMDCLSETACSYSMCLPSVQ